jgi:hypothetical protein
MATIAIRWVTPTIFKSLAYSKRAVAGMMHIYVDEHKVATIGESNRECEIQVSSGKHKIYGGVFILRSKTINFNIEDHQTLKFYCSEKPLSPAHGQLGMAILAARYVIPGQVLEINEG